MFSLLLLPGLVSAKKYSQSVLRKDIVFSSAVQTLFKGVFYFIASRYQFMIANVKNVIACFEGAV
jgi:hypothetical protein